MNCNKIILTFIALLFAIPLNLFSQDNFADRIIKVTANDGIGNFDLNGTQAQIVGIAYLSNPNLPDIFIQSTSLYPDFSRYKSIGRDANGIPIFGEKIKVALPSTASDDIFPSYIFQSEDEIVHMVWYGSGAFRYGVYDEQTNRIVEKRSYTYTTAPLQLSAYIGSDSKLHIIFSSNTQGGRGINADGLGKYNGANIYRGKLGYVGFYELSFPGLLEGTPSARRLVTNPSTDVYMRHNAIGVIQLKSGKEGCLISGSQFGEISYYENIGTISSPTYQKRKPIINAEGQIIRHPAIAPYPIAFPAEGGALTDIIASSEGSICYYKFTGTFSGSGSPIYEEPVQLLRKDADLVGGSLIVPCVVDWDGDGILDIVSGNSMGFIYFFKNFGDNKDFAFSRPEKVTHKDGEPIFVQGAYGETTQGVYEARWGYTSPNIIDWDGDGHLDILMGDARGKHPIIRGSDDGMEDEKFLYLNGLNSHGNWRDRPGIAVVGDSTLYITFDEDNNFHLYKKAGTYNLIDGGKLKLTTGEFISSSRDLISAYNETGRAKFEVVDWDGDGLLDLLVGTTGAMAIPSPANGLPQKSPLKRANVLFLKNTGTNMQPRYQFPVALTYKGKSMDFGWHECGVVATRLGGGSGLNLLIGGERGRYYLFDRENLSNTATKYLGVPIEVFSDDNLAFRPVTNNVKIYLDKDYTFQDNVGAFSENRFVQISSTNPASFQIKPKYTGVVYIATDAKELPSELSGVWKKSAYSDLKYKMGSSQLEDYTIYYRDVKEGEVIKIPHLGSLGSLVLSSAITKGNGSSLDEEQIIYSEKYSIYPNPAKSFIKVDRNEYMQEQPESIKILNILGEVVYSGIFERGKMIDVSAYSRGMYLVCVGEKSMKLLLR